MKKLFSIVLLLGCLLSLSAQEMQMKITVKDGGVVVKDAEGNEVTLSGELTLAPDAFSKIYFDYAPIEGLEAVDMGLESGVLWATVNYKATKPEEVGQLCPWSTTDMVYEDWGKPYGWKWRTPSKDEVLELIRDCNWTWGDLNGVNGYWVSNKNDAEKKIFLPVTGYKDMETERDRYSNKGYYWTSTPYDSDAQKAHCLVFEENDEYGRDEEMKINLLAIRPVWGDAPVIWSMSVGEPSSIGLDAASIPVTVTIDKPDALDEYGIEYSMDQSSWTAVKAVNGVANLTRLSAATTYYYRGYAKVNGSTNYAEGVQNFTTASKTLELNAVSAAATAYNAAEVTLTLAGNVLSEVTYGVVYAPKADWADTSKRKEQRGTQVASGNSFTAKIALSDLEAETVYQYEAYAQCDGVGQKTAGGEFETPRQSKYTTPAYVDLGLSVKWATFDLGATKEFEKGQYIGWGDPTGELTEYRDGLYAPTVRGDSCISGNTEWDIATVQLGGHWRLPTAAEIEELNQCSFAVVTREGTKGCVISGIGDHRNDNIFIPLAGYQELTTLVDAGNFAYLWSGNHIAADDYAVSYQINASTGRLTRVPCPKPRRICIRPVWDDGTKPEPVVVVDKTSTIVPGSDKDNRTGLIPQDGVDMGSGVKWARWNVGVKSKTGDLGRYYAWGDTITRESYSITEYESCPYYMKPARENGFLEIEPENDVATCLWGEGWRMPSEGEFAMLLYVSEIKWKKVNGIQGYELKSLVTGDSIFIGAGGHMSGTQLMDKGVEGRYWNRTVWISTSNKEKEMTWAQCLYFYKGLVEPQTTGLERYMGMLVRPVKAYTDAEAKAYAIKKKEYAAKIAAHRKAQSAQQK